MLRKQGGGGRGEGGGTEKNTTCVENYEKEPYLQGYVSEILTRQIKFSGPKGTVDLPHVLQHGKRAPLLDDGIRALYVAAGKVNFGEGCEPAEIIR